MKQGNSKQILDLLAKEYVGAKTELKFGSVYQLLVAVILSAQCTDKRVNEVTPSLFSVADNPADMVALGQERLERLIHSCGFYRAKAKHILSASRDIVEKFNGQVPESKQDLLSLDGVGEKTACVVWAVGFGHQAIAVDTHVFRVANRLGLTHADNVTKTQFQLEQLIDKDRWSDYHHYILLHGRYVCMSRKPLCDKCKLCDYCEFYAKREDKID